MREFKTQQELKSFLNPVLKLRIKSLKKEGLEFSENTLFKILKEEKWSEQTNLHLYEMVDDILHYKIDKRQGDRNETI